jgi:enoyl-CoA hydratase
VDNESQVLCDVRKGVGWITLNRPRAINSLTVDMVKQIDHQLEQWRNDPGVSLICIQGAGEKGFCAGGDMRFFYDHREDNVESLARSFFTLEYHMDEMIHRYPKPIIAYMDGIVMGGGVGISIGASERIVTERTKLAMPEMNIGFFPDVGASYFLNQMPGSIGRYLALTCEMLKAPDLLYVGAADRYIERGRWEEVFRAIESRNWTLNDHPSQTAEALSKLLDEFTVKTLPDAPLISLKEKIDAHFSFDTMEEIYYSLQQAATSGDEWAAHTIGTLRTKSPTSLKVALKQLIYGKHKTLEECFQMELGISLHFMHNHDFYEGVRAVLVDKDRNPQWKPSSLEEVTDEQVESFFG